MLRSKVIEDQLRNERLDAKTRDSLFRRRIEHGAKVAPFVSTASCKPSKRFSPLITKTSRTNSIWVGFAYSLSPHTSHPENLSTSARKPRSS